ncbi:MAG: hypothetical protein KGI98_10925 [Euryarchaeota archaeon]|nr:hypothetical protein [Euryarchaeota archaeon]
MQDDFLAVMALLHEDPTYDAPDPVHHVQIEPLRGPAELRKLVHRLSKDDPGYRGLYLLHRGTAYFYRFRRRDPLTYRNLHRDIQRALADIPELERQWAHSGTDGSQGQRLRP